MATLVLHKTEYYHGTRYYDCDITEADVKQINDWMHENLVDCDFELTLYDVKMIVEHNIQDENGKDYAAEFERKNTQYPHKECVLDIVWDFINDWLCDSWCDDYDEDIDDEDIDTETLEDVEEE